MGVVQGRNLGKAPRNRGQIHRMTDKGNAMSNYGWDEPEPYIERDDGDAAYERFSARVDNGEQCPVCREIHTCKRSRALGLDLFTCAFCSAEFFDLVTRPTVEA